MPKAFRWVTATVLILFAFAAPLANGANEPWASKTDPTDEPKSHVQEVTAAPFTYSITQGGTIDGKMCTSLPGVWEPFEQTWESNRSIRMENVGSANVINPWLTIGPIDFFNQQTIANSVTKGLTSDREKALAIFYFYITHRFHKGCGGTGGAQGDATQAMNIFGFNTCGDSTLCIADLVSKAGVPDCAFSHHPGHCVPQVFFDGKYNTLDGDMATFMLMRDNRTLASEVDMVRDHDLIKRVHQYGILGRSNHLLNEDYAACYTWEGDTIWKIKGWAHQDMGMVLRPHEAIEWRWGHEKPVKYHGDVTGHPPFAPDSVCNGLWEYAPDFQHDAQWRAGASVTDIVNKDGVLTAKDGGTGTILWTMKSPFAFIGGALAATGQGYAFEVGFTDAKDWRKRNFTPLAMLADFDGQFKNRPAMAVEYWLKCTLKGDASLIAINIKNDIQMAPLSMPSMTVGDNSFTYLEHPSSSGSSESRNLKITHNWVETSRTRPPKASEASIYPADGGRSDGTDVAFQWKPAADPDGDAVTDYHFQLADRSDMRWPLSPNFDKYISRTPDKGETQYTLARPGLLTPGVTYYWHVKAKDAKGAWGPWSATWSFTAEGPAYPISVALTHDASKGIGTLTWSANPVGRTPAKYRVYGSDEKGFTVHDEPYEVRLGMTKELASPFPANFVAEVAGTSLEVVGISNALPNANKAYYRVVAVDDKGKRSGDSDYVEARRPFIYSAPVTAAPAGKPYSYQVKAIRSLGDLTSRLEAKPKPGPKFWKIEPLKFSLLQKPDWMSIDPDTGLITGTPDGTGGTVIVSVTLTKELRLVHDNEGGGICWGNEWGKSTTYENLGPVTQQFFVRGEKVRAHLIQQAKDFVPGRPGAQYPWGPEAGSAIAFDLGAPLLSASEQQDVSGFLRQLAQDAIQYHTNPPLTPNMSFVCHWRIGLIGYAIADPQIIEWAVNDPGPPWGGKQPGRWGAFKQRLEHALTDGAFWDEAPIYGNFSILGMMYLAEAARHYDGTDLYNYASSNGGSLRKAVAGLVSLAYPIERYLWAAGPSAWSPGATAPPLRPTASTTSPATPSSSTSRTSFPSGRTSTPSWRLRTTRGRIPSTPTCSRSIPAATSVSAGSSTCLSRCSSLLLGETLPPETPPAAMPSSVYPQTGIALLRSDESPGYWTSAGLVAVQQMGRNYGHDHRDKFELIFWGRGRLLYPDWNAQQYEPMEYGWTRNAWAHNTLVVDESNPKGGSSTERHEFSAEAKFLATTSREIYPDVAQTRALLLTDEYLLDLFWADSPRERTYDWFVHALGQLSVPAPRDFQPSQDLLRPYHWVDRERKWETDRTWSADFVQQTGGVLHGMGQYTDEWFSAKVGVRLTMLGEPGTAAYVGEGLFNPVPTINVIAMVPPIKVSTRPDTRQPMPKENRIFGTALRREGDVRVQMSTACRRIVFHGEPLEESSGS